ncbi:hypothetical protein D3C75_860110 [compost metagenome]
MNADLDFTTFNVDGLALVASQRLGQSGIDETEGHGVDIDLQAAPLLGQGLGHADDAGLGGGVVGLTGVTASGHGGNVDDLAQHFAAFRGVFLSLGADDRLGCTQNAERCGQVAVDDRVPLFVGHFLNDVVPGVPGVVDDDVDATVALHGSLYEALGEIGGGHAADAGNGFTTGLANFSHDFFGRCRVQIVDHDFGAIGR